MALVQQEPELTPAAVATPAHGAALLSFVGVRDAWEMLRDELTDVHSLDLDEALDEIEADTGIDIEQDILSCGYGGVGFRPAPSRRRFLQP